MTTSMTTAAELEAVALRVEREEPSRRLDEWLSGMFSAGAEVLPYTTSLDAAASLMPSGWVVNDVMQSIHGSWYVRLWPTDASAIGMAEGNAPDEPRARTAAALRAMAQEARDE